MTALTATIELDPAWRFYGEGISGEARAELLAPTLGFSPNVWELGGNTWVFERAIRVNDISYLSYPYSAVSAAEAVSGRSFETFPSVVEITWYGQAASGINLTASVTVPGLARESPFGYGAVQELPTFMPGETAAITRPASLSLLMDRQPILSDYGFVSISQTVRAWADLITNSFSQSTPAVSPPAVSYDVLSVNPVAMESITAPDDCVIQISDPVHSRLAKKIRAVYEIAELEKDAAEPARRAVNDAIKFVDFNLPGGEPLVMLSDDGVLSLQWRRGERGVMLLFPGDGTGTYSIKEPGGSYAIGARDFPLEAGLVEEVRAAIDTREAA